MLANCGPVLYDLAAYSGLRRAELCGLRWSDIDPDGAGIQIRQTIIELSRGQARPVELTCPDLRPGACRAALQTAEVSEGPTMGAACAPAQEALIAHRAAQAQERAEFGGDYREHDLVFCYVDGDPCDRTS